MSRQTHQSVRAGTRQVVKDQDEVYTRALVARIKAGDRAALSELIDRYRNQIGALAYKMVGDFDEAADITQIVFVKVAANIDKYDEKRRFYTWLYRIAYNAGIDYIRKHKRHRHEPIEAYQERTDADAPDPEFELVRSRLKEHIDQAADNLNDKQRSAFILRDVQGRKIDDVASMMQMPEATVRWYLHRARTKVRRDLLRRCPHLLAMLGIG